MSLEAKLNWIGEVIQSKDLPDGKLKIIKHISDIIEPGKEMYTLWHIKKLGATSGELASQFSSRYFETLTLKQCQTYFDRIGNWEDLIRLSDEYNAQMDASR